MGHCTLGWSLRFTDCAFEDAFKADAFRNLVLFHCAMLSSVVAALGLGLCDPTFGPIALCLLPIAVLELWLRVILHRHAYFRARLILAQSVGASAMLALTTLAWAAYHIATHEARDQPPASPLISAVVPLLMVTYPSTLGLYLLSPSQKVVAAVVSFIAVLVSPRWSSLKDRPAFEGEHSLHLLALTLGALIAYPIERMMRASALKSIRTALHNERTTRELMEHLEASLQEALAREDVARDQFDAQVQLVAAERQAKEKAQSQAEMAQSAVEEAQCQAEEAEQTWSDHQAAQRQKTVDALQRVAQLESSSEHRRTEMLKRRVAQLEQQLADDKLEQSWLATFAVSRNVDEADGSSPHVKLFRPPPGSNDDTQGHRGHRPPCAALLPGSYPVRTSRLGAAPRDPGAPTKLRRPQRSKEL